MLKNKIMVSVIAVAAGFGPAFGAASLRTGDRAGSLRVTPAVTTVKTGGTGTATTTTNTATSLSGGRMATLPGPTNISTKPKLPSSASAASVADLKNKLDQLAQEISDLANAGVDEGAVRDIIDSELAGKNYATVPYVDTADSAKLDTDEFANKFDTRVTEKQLVDETALAAHAYTKPEVDGIVAAIKPSAAIRYDESTGDLQYQDSNDSWTTFANKSDFAGTDGKNIELQKTDNAIQRRVKGSGENWQDLVSLDEITGATGTTGADACEPKYSSAITADGDTRVTITCVNDDTKVLGQYTVSKGADGAIPCPGGIELEQDTAYSGADGATKYDLVCKE